MKRFLSLNKRRTSIFILLFFAIATMAETEIALIITPRSGSKQQHALAQIGHVKITEDSLLVFSHENKVLGRNAISNIQYIKYDEYIPNPSGQCGDSLWWEFNPTDSTLTITGSGAMYNYSSLDRPWTEYRQDILHVVIEEGATMIGTSAFDGCSSLSDLTWHEGLDSIGEYAFKNCASLTELTIPQSVSWIGRNAFESCTSLSSVTLNDNDKALKDNVFKYCNSLTQLTIPATWHAIPYQAFRDVTGLEQVILPDSLDTIGDGAFSYCKKLRSISIPSTLKHIGGSAFDNCDSLSTIYWDAANYIQTTGYSPFVDVREHVTEFTIGPNVTSLPQFLCFNFSALTSVDIPATVRTLGTSAFDGCSSLSDLTWYEGLDSLGEYAFKNCTSLTELTIPQSVSWIGRNAFESCTSLSSVTLNDNDKALKDNVFKYCNSLTQLTIPATWHAIPYQAFRDVTGLEQVILPDSLDTIGDGAFSYCKKLRSISIPSTLKHIGGSAFDNCDSLHTIYWDAANYIQTTGYSPFVDVRTHVTEFTIGPNVTSLPQFLCFQFTALTSVEIPAAVHTLGTSAFDGCSSLSDLTWYEGLDSIGEYAFKNCSSLTELTIPQSVSWIGRNAFESCPLMEMTSLATAPPTITAYTFYNVDKSIPLHVPARSVRTYRAATGWSDFTNYVLLPCDTTFYAEEDTSICEGNGYVWNDKELTAAGTYIDTLLTEEGCDSIVTLTLHVNRCYVDVNKDDTVCVGTTFLGHTITMDNTIISDTVVTLVPGTPDTITHWTVYIYDNPVPATMYALALTNALPTVKQGCVIDVDPEILINYLNANPATGKTDNVVDVEWQYKINQGDSYEPIDNTIKLAKDVESIIVRYVITETECGTTIIRGSDTVLYTLAYEYRESDEIETQTICDGDSLLWRGHYYSVAGTYKDTITLSEATCNYDSIYTLNLIVNSTYTSEDSASICDSELPYIWHSQEYNETGNYQTTLTSITGCDSVVTLHLTVNPTYYTEETITICQGEVFYFHDEMITESGIYADTTYTMYGCESIVQYIVTVNPSFFFEDSAVICQGTSYLWHDKDYYQAGIYYDSLTTIHGCDSIYRLTLTVLPTYTTEESATICESELPYIWHGQEYNETGDYETTLASITGCDSLVTLHLTVQMATYALVEDWTTCESSLPYIWRGKSIAAEGSYFDTIRSTTGCDSMIYTLNLTIQTAIDAPATDTTVCEGDATLMWRGKVWPVADTAYFDTVRYAETGCDNMRYTLNVTVNRATYAPAEDWTICENSLPFTWRDMSITAAGTYYDTTYYASGCVSAYYTLNLTVNSNYETEESATICESEVPYIWHGENYYQTGDYETTLASITGCDSIVTLHLTVQTVIYSDVEQWTVCESELPVLWHSNVITTAGTYYDTARSIIGCDSMIYTMRLTVHETYQVTEEAAICEGETYIWHGCALTKKGTYLDTLQSVQGCDSICTLILTVNEKYLIEDIVSIREDKLPYMWQGERINQAGDYRKEYTSIYGCDSVHTLHLVVTALPIYTVNVIADHGRVNGTGTYAEGTLIHLEAVPDEGFEFQMWSDGSETNPKDFVVMQDTTLRAHFFMPEVEQEVIVDSIETTSVTIVWDTVPGAILYELRIFKNGLLIVTFEVDPDNNIVGVHHIGPDRLVARKDSTGGSSETLQVNVGGLDPGSDYTYSLDALDDDRSFVGAQSGSFTTEEEETGLRDTLFDDRRPQPRKILQDGHLYIEMPDGTWYSAEGHLLE